MSDDPGAVGRPLVIGGGLVLAAWLFWDGRDFWPRIVSPSPQAARVFGLFLRCGALALLLPGLFGLFLALRRWRGGASEPMPRGFWLAMLIPAAIALLTVLVQISESMLIVVIVMPIPILIVSLIIWRSMQTARASHWTEASGRVTRSEIEVRRHRFQNDVTQITDVPLVHYEFTVAGQTIQGTRICFGDAGPTPQGVLRRYPKDAVVKVFYDPANPNESVLERDAPLSMGCLFSIAIGLLATGAAIVVAISHGSEIDTFLASHVPILGPSPVFTLVFAGGGIFMLMLTWAGMKQVSAARRWPVTSGTVVSSHVESYRKRVGGAQSGRMTTFYQAVVEYSYSVDSQSYHSAQVSFGAVEGSSQQSAEAKAARYPNGTKVEVHYDPTDPSQAVLEVRFALNWLLILLALVFLTLAFFFSG